MSATAVARLPVARQHLLLATGVVLTAATRRLIGGEQAASSMLAAAVSSIMLLTLAVAAGWRPGRFSRRNLAIGLVGTVVLLFPVDLQAATLRLPLQSPDAAVLPWAALVVVVAVSEELVLRGVLFTAVEQRHGSLVAVAVTAVIFAVIHLPLYGPTALPLDLAVGVWLGGLRLWGGVSSAATAHVLADLATAVML